MLKEGSNSTVNYTISTICFLVLVLVLEILVAFYMAKVIRSEINNSFLDDVKSGKVRTEIQRILSDAETKENGRFQKRSVKDARNMDTQNVCKIMEENCPRLPIGPPGPMGASGPPGDKGATGYPGPRGGAGGDGFPGETGARGSPGYLGMPGLQGQSGWSGSTGMPGSPGSRSSFSFNY